jgi:glucose/arabinose dehydrogenase
MRMEMIRRSRTFWLWGIIGLEVITIIILMIAALIRDDPQSKITISRAPHTPATSAGFQTPVIKSVVFAEGLEAPTNIESSGIPGDKRLFVTEQKGRIRSIDANGKLAAQPVLDISSKVQYQGEMGLLGLAFHPKFKDNHMLFVYYVNQQQQSVLARFETNADATEVKSGSEKILLTVDQPYGNHKGGQLAFGPDGYLYFGLGDGGSAGDPQNYAQNKNTLLGKIIRLDVSKENAYSVPATNPFKTDPTAKPEIWAWGLRNPWRFSFDPKTGDLYIADVGQNKYEEVHVQSAGSKGGENYGWRCLEGTHAFNMEGCQSAEQYVAPAFEYSHDQGRCSITGGFVYRGASEEALVGKYFYGDFCSGEVFYAEKVNGTWKQTLATETGHKISTFGPGKNNELYYADSASGSVYKLIDTAN